MTSSELIKTIMERPEEEESELWKQHRVIEDLKRISAQSDQPHYLGTVADTGKFVVYFPNDEGATTDSENDKPAPTSAMKELPGKFERVCTITDYLTIKQAELAAKKLAEEEEERKRLEQEREKEKVRMEEQNKGKPTYIMITKMNNYSGARGGYGKLDTFKFDEIDILPLDSSSSDQEQPRQRGKTGTEKMRVVIKNTCQVNSGNHNPVSFIREKFANH